MAVVEYSLNLHLSGNDICTTIVDTQVDESILLNISISDYITGGIPTDLYPIYFCGLIKTPTGKKYRLQITAADSSSNDIVIVGDIIKIRHNDLTKTKGTMLCELFFTVGESKYLITNPFIIKVDPTSKASVGNVLPELDIVYEEIKRMLADYKAGEFLTIKDLQELTDDDLHADWALINDDEPSATHTYSSNKIESLVSDSGSGKVTISWNDIIGKPTIPGKTSDLINDNGLITQDSLKDYAKATDLDNYNGKINEINTQITAINGSLSSLIEETTFTDDEGGTKTLKVKFSEIQQEVNGISTKVEDANITQYGDDIAKLKENYSDMKQTSEDIKTKVGNVETDLHTNYVTNETFSEVEQTANDVSFKFYNYEESNLLSNTKFPNFSIQGWGIYRCAVYSTDYSGSYFKGEGSINFRITNGNTDGYIYQKLSEDKLLLPGKQYTLSLQSMTEFNITKLYFTIRYTRDDTTVISTDYDLTIGNKLNPNDRQKVSFTTPDDEKYNGVYVYIRFVCSSADDTAQKIVILKNICLSESPSGVYTARTNEVTNGKTVINSDGVKIFDGALTVVNSNGETVIDGSKKVFQIYKYGSGYLHMDANECTKTITIAHGMSAQPSFHGEFMEYNEGATEERAIHMSPYFKYADTIDSFGHYWLLPSYIAEMYADSTNLYIRMKRSSDASISEGWGIYYRYYLFISYNI